MENISLSVPMTYSALSAAITMLQTLVNGMVEAGPSLADHEHTATTIEQITQAEIDAGNLGEEDEVQTETPASEVFGAVPNGSSLFDEDAEDPKPQAAVDTVNSAAEIAPSVPTVDLDSDGLPWDVRIGSGGKTKLAKTQQWKPKRKPNTHTQEQWDAYVAEVKAELKAAMAAPGPNATEQPAPAAASPTPTATTSADAPTPAPAPVVETPVAAPVEVKYQTADGQWTEAQLVTANYTPEQIAALPAVAPVVDTPKVTLPELMAKVTASGITPEKLLEAVKARGLASTPLLGTRTDIIPLVYADLFGG